jgi:hypothetical protein
VPVNKFFANYPNRYSQEQALVEDLIVESIKIYGCDCYYIVRESIDGSEQDLIYGENPTSKFSKTYIIEMYLNEFLDNKSGGDFLSKFGLQINESSTFLISRRTFNKYVPKDIATRPREGDLIYHPTLRSLFEIKHVNSQSNFYTLGRDSQLPYMYNVSCELFKYSQEPIETGYPVIDDIDLEGAYTIDLHLDIYSNPSAPNYNIGEVVFQGTDINTALARATVADWNPITKVLNIIDIKGTFAVGDTITGQDSNAYYSILSFNDMADNTVTDSYHNEEIQSETDLIIDDSEHNPWGKP